MNLPLLRPLFVMLSLAVPFATLAAGLGELRGQPVLGERLRAEVEIIGADQRYPDASCFRLSRPAGSNDLPWLQSASLAVRAGQPPVLEIRSAAILRDPVMQISLQLGCGYEISREYVLLAMPAGEPVQTAAPAAKAERALPPPAREVQRIQRKPPPDDAQRAVTSPQSRRVVPPTDRLMLSGGGGGEAQMLRMATELLSLREGRGVTEAKRDILRLEFRMLMALGEQADSQLATAEKLRNMETTLGELQARAADFAARVEQGGAMPAQTGEAKPAAPTTRALPVPIETPAEPGWLSEWSFYGALIGIVAGLAGWLGWRRYDQARQAREDADFPLLAAAEPLAPCVGEDAPAAARRGDPLDISLESHGASATPPLDLELVGSDEGAGDGVSRGKMETAVSRDSAMPVAEATLGEHFEANPVMELADIMLSFGRVKGAAQALREYIDNNPQEALQPWIRLMDVYRMAGMRDEFEEVARNLNQHFNVEVQHWEGGSAPVPAAEQPRPESLEDLPRIMGIICELWWTGDVVGYLYQLLRDNRGGKRAGFALPLVEEILFLIELKETSNRIEKKEESHE